jgi:DNA adenine methylase
MGKMIRSPFKWVGGKYKLRKKIISILPVHECYVEVFGGAAWVLMGKQPSNVEVLNDIDGELINFFRVIKKQPRAFINSFKWDLVSRHEFERLTKINPERLSPVVRAHRFYYLVMAGWGGELDSPRFQTSILDAGHGNRLIGALKQLENRIMPVYSRLQTVIIEQLDWKDCIERYDDKKTVMYLDPPYPGNNCNYRFNLRDVKDHEQIAKILRKTKAKIILSTYNLPALSRLFSDFFVQPVEFPSGMQGANGRINRELIVTNFEYDLSLLSSDKSETPV